MNTMTATSPRLQTFLVTVLCATFIVAFARTFYLRFLFDVPPLARAGYIHGIIATVWVGLHYTQARLIAARNVALHKRMGILTAAVGAVLIVQTLDMVFERTVAGLGPRGRDPLQFLSVQLGTVTMFTAFLISALLLRKRREWHKRLMLLATMALLTPAVARIDAITFRPLGVPPLVLPMMVTAAFLAWAWVRDWRQRGHIHPALLYGGILLLVTMPLRRWIGFTDGWRPIAEQLVAWMT
jgi:hypothetical protein